MLTARSCSPSMQREPVGSARSWIPSPNPERSNGLASDRSSIRLTLILRLVLIQKPRMLLKPRVGRSLKLVRTDSSRGLSRTEPGAVVELDMIESSRGPTEGPGPAWFCSCAGRWSGLGLPPVGSRPPAPCPLASAPNANVLLMQMEHFQVLFVFGNSIRRSATSL